MKIDLEAPEVKNEESDILMDPGDAERDKSQDFNASDLLEPKMEVMEQEASDEERSNFPHMYYGDNNTLANPFAALQGNFVPNTLSNSTVTNKTTLTLFFYPR